MNAVADSIVHAQVPEWPEPQPLITSEPNAPYPFEALPDIIRRAVQEVQAYVQSPIPLIAQSALTASAIAVQARFDVARDNSLRGPCSLFMLALGDSGERKTSGDGYFMQAIEAHEKAELERVKPEQQAHNADIESWEAKRAAVANKIKIDTKAGKPTKDAEQQLRDLQAEEPEQPRYQRILFADATPEALAARLYANWPSGAVCSDEAGVVLGSHGMGAESQMRNLTMFNMLWGGQTLTVDRKTGPSYRLVNARLSMALQAQEPVVLQFIEKTGQLARGSGFFARFLLSMPESTQGQRPYNDPPSGWPCLSVFNARISELLTAEIAIHDGVLEPSTLHLSADAKTLWVEYHDIVEVELREEGDFHGLRDSASKIAENAARIAAIFELMTSPDARSVSAEMMKRAVSVSTWHLYEAKRFFNKIVLPEPLLLANMLDEWLIKHCAKQGTSTVPRRYIRQYGPSPLRDAKRLSAAIDELLEADHINEIEIGKKSAIQVNPALLRQSRS